MANYTGVAKWFDNEKGYRFISSKDGQDDKGLSAFNVQKI